MIEEKFIRYGFTKEEFLLIREYYPLIKMTDETLLKHFNEINYFFEQNGYSKEEVIKMTKLFPKLYSHNIENIKQKIEDMVSLGYNKEEVIKMTKSLPPLYGYNIENIKQKIEDMVTLGYNKEEVIKMTKSLPTLYGYNIENIKQKIEDMVSLGYSKEEVIKMTKSFPSLYSHNIENIKQKIEDMLTLGYNKEEVIKMTKSLPTLYGYNIENIKQKIDYYDSINLRDFTIIDSKCLMQSVTLSFARFEFYKEKGIIIDMKNYYKLFIGQKKFEKTYGITKEELLLKYSFEKYMEERKNGRTI